MNDFEDIEDDIKPLRLRPVMTGEFFNAVIAYPVIVEGWDKAKSGRHKRRYVAEFTLAERRLLARYYPKFYRWYFVTGIPARVTMELKTINLLRRAAFFFSEV